MTQNPIDKTKKVIDLNNQIDEKIHTLFKHNTANFDPYIGEICLEIMQLSNEINREIYT